MSPTRMTTEETWDLRSTLPPLVAVAVRQIRDRGNGVPGGLDGPEQWHHILTQIIDDLEKVADDGEHVPAKALDLMKEHWLALWD